MTVSFVLGILYIDFFSDKSVLPSANPASYDLSDQIETVSFCLHTTFWSLS